MNLALKMFIDEKGKELLEKNLYRNFVLHVCNLFEFGVLGPGHVFTAITRIQKFVNERNYSFAEWPQQRSHWEKFPKISAELTSPKALNNEQKQKSGSARKDFSGIFKNSDFSPFVVLSPLSIQHSSGIIVSSDNEDEANEEAPPVKQEELLES